MAGQDFKSLISELGPSLKKLIRKRPLFGFIGIEDLYQEALINLWMRSERGEFCDKPRSYVLKSCYFHIQNYMRTHRDSRFLVSLDEPFTYEEGNAFTLGDTIVDHNAYFLNRLNSQLVIDEIMSNGLSMREREVFCLLYKGLNIREVARKLGVSHVRVVKLRNSIRQKCLKHIDVL